MLPAGSHETEAQGVCRIGQKEVICEFFEENQMRHGEIMSIVTNQALDAILTQQVIEIGPVLRLSRNSRAQSGGIEEALA
jgi:hypothetical protein